MFGDFRMKNKITITLLIISVALNILIGAYTLRINFQNKSRLESFFQTAVSEAQFQLSLHIQTHQSNLNENSPQLVSAISNIDKLGAIAFVMKIPDSQALQILAQMMIKVPETSSAHYLEIAGSLMSLTMNAYDSQAYIKLNEIADKIVSEFASNGEEMYEQP